MATTAPIGTNSSPRGKQIPMRERSPHSPRAYPQAKLPASDATRLSIELTGGGADLLAVILGDDTARRSERLISAAGGLAALAACSSAMLVQQYALDTPAAERIAVAFALGRRVAMEPRHDRPSVHSMEQAAALLMPLMSGLVQEQLRVLLLDSKNRMLANLLVYQGTVNACLVREAELLRDAVRCNAPSVILAHNHPSGATEPSPEDLQLTRSFIAAGKLLDIAVLDHLIIGANTYLSLRLHQAHDISW